MRRGFAKSFAAALLIVVCFLLALAASAPAPGTIRFEEVSARAGVRFVVENSATTNKNQIETMVGRVALLDYDRDGLLDIYFVNGAAIPSLHKEDPRFYNRLFHNNGDGTFTDVTDKAGVRGSGYGMGVAAAGVAGAKKDGAKM